MSVKPITPKEASSGRHIPDVVIETVNEFLRSRGASRRIVLPVDLLVRDLVAKGLDRKEIFDQGWLDFEDRYIQAGWDVEYDKAAYNETGVSKFIFTPAL